MSRGLRALLVCSGLDHAHRGYESFARECFAALRDEPGLDLELVKSSGTARAGERLAWTLRRDRLAARGLGWAIAARPFRVEAFAFGFSLQPLLLRRPPDVVYLSEWDTARVLARWRALTRQRFKILFSNGGFAASGFEHLDHVQELTPAGRDYVLERGADPRRHTVLPMGFHIERTLAPVTAEVRRELRGRLELPQDRSIVVSLAALNSHHKRLDYVIEEVAALERPRPFLLLDGQPEEETPALRALARERLGPDGYDIRTSPSATVPDVLRACDTFVLASLAETQGRALIEAMAHGVPCLAHDSPITRFATGPHGFYGDLVARGSLTRLLRECATFDAGEMRARIEAGHRHVYERFSWERLRPRYLELLAAVANNTVSSSSGDAVRR